MRRSAARVPHVRGRRGRVGAKGAVEGHAARDIAMYAKRRVGYASGRF
jgi:hypothetical protein